jgi:hypothetical protein
MKKVLLFSILGGTAVLTAGIVGLVLWMLGNGEKTARHASSRFAAALVAADPQRAPEGAREYVSGVPAHFGKVSAAEVIDARNEKRTRTRNTGGVVSSVKHRKYRARRTSRNTTTFSVADVLVRTARGPAVLELEFTPSLTNGSETVSDVRELAPQEIRDGVLDDDVRAEHAAAFKARGGVAATHFELIGASARIASITKPKPRATPQSAALTRLRCIQAAQGDVTKMTRCAEQS